MKAKLELKMKIKQHARQVDDIKMREKSFYNAQKLWQKGTLIKHDRVLHKKLFNRVEDARNIWWKSIDKKLELEQDIKVLEQKVIDDLMKEMM
uniref:Uncharacterized protein n=1 Tax=Vibrio phage P018-4 TaxID=3229728 RepID=A0AB39AJC3_9CAUD